MSALPCFEDLFLLYDQPFYLDYVCDPIPQVNYILSDNIMFLINVETITFFKKYIQFVCSFIYLYNTLLNRISVM